MCFNKTINNISVLGAGGKMGGGILTLLVMEMGKNKLKNPKASYTINAIDVSQEALENILVYVEGQLRKFAEKKINLVKTFCSQECESASDADIVEKYVSELMNMIVISTNLEVAYKSSYVFEAIKEDVGLKAKLFGQIYENNPEVKFLTNTSSIPINFIEKAAKLNGNIIGFHFYNPPIVQKLVELISTDNTSTELIEFSKSLALAMKKIIVPSNDKAAFIGNGHFLRDAMYALETAEKLTDKMPWHEAILVVDNVSRDMLIRPMGIFQLLDYVGIDVVCFILNNMQSFFAEEKLKHELLDKMIKLSVKGGQFSNGSQKDGIFKYEKGKIVGVYSTETQKYINLTEINDSVRKFMGEELSNKLNWKTALRSEKKNELLKEFFADLYSANTTASKMAVEYGENSKLIAEFLINKEIANTKDDVNTVLKTGFFHAYGPLNEYFK